MSHSPIVASAQIIGANTAIVVLEVPGVAVVVVVVDVAMVVVTTMTVVVVVAIEVSVLVPVEVVVLAEFFQGIVSWSLLELFELLKKGVSGAVVMEVVDVTEVIRGVVEFELFEDVVVGIVVVVHHGSLSSFMHSADVNFPQ